MKKIIFILLFFTLTLSARENPFSPQDIIIKPKPITKKIQLQKKPIKVFKEVKIKEPQKVIPSPKPKVIKKAAVKPKPVVKVKPITKVKKRKIRKSTIKPKLIYNGTFAKIKRYKNTIQIITKDEKLQHLKLTHPNRIAFDFERFDVVSPFTKKIKSRYVRQLKVGHHDYFYRITFNLAKNYRFKITKKPYGYFIKLY